MSLCSRCSGSHKASEVPKCAEKQRAYNRTYYLKNRERLLKQHREYLQRPEAKAKRQARQREYRREYRQRPEVRAKRQAYHQSYNQRLEVREKNRVRMWAYYHRPGVKERMRAYYHRPEANKRKRAYYQRPVVKERRRTYMSNYRQRPEAKQRKRVLTRVHRRCHGIEPRKQNRAEQLLDTLLADHFPGDWRYTGQGDVVIGRCAPDFFQANGKKGIIELFGCYFHGCPTCGPPLSKNANQTRDTKRIQMFESLGIKTLVVWEHELESPASILRRVQEAFYD